MCTCMTYQHYFGRTLDVTHTYDEIITITPRHYPLKFRKASLIKNHYAIIGMAKVVDGYPLYFDATNEKGLSMAGLNFADTQYGTPLPSFDNTNSF